MLYAADLSGRGRSGDAAGEAPDVPEVFDRVALHFDLHEGARAFAEELVRGVAARREELDARIAEHARNWRLERMAAVDRNVLRLATFELLHTDTPDRVVIDEAIELARDFGGDRSPSFVNGVLDAIARAAGQGGSGAETAPAVTKEPAEPAEGPS